jgi:hypothetical protein
MVKLQRLRSLMRSVESWQRETESIGIALAVCIWILWFGCLVLVAIYGWPVLADSDFVAGTGIASSLAILCTLRPSIRSQRLHVIMLCLCCILHFGLLFRPHVRFIRTFARIEEEMTSLQVKEIMQNYNISEQHGKTEAETKVSMQSALFTPKYSGTIFFNHYDHDTVGGTYCVTFKQGRITTIILCDD